MPRKDDDYSKTFMVLLYPEDESQAYAIEQLKKNAYDSAGILHEKCVCEDGTTKKPHYHFVLRFPNQKARSTIAKELQIQPNYLEPSSSMKQALLYLIHRGWPEKYQYDVNDVFGTLKKQLLVYLDDSTENERVLRIIELLEQQEGIVTMKDFISLCAKEDLYTDLRRGGYLLASMLKEHNRSVYGYEE